MDSAAANEQQAEQPSSYTFSKEERLCSKRLTALLFSKGSSFNLYPLRFVYYTPQDPLPGHTQVLISVSKRYFKRAVDRNRLKRQIREAFRLNKHILAQSQEQAPQLLGIIYIGKEKKSFHSIQKKLISGLVRCLNK
ncbi:ribonuclease P protein component [Pontibacter ummariensis]|uniref:Ribonuclease P protein component n=1 Tax=Pontibacter ummariensis TaxID=1610492 RepID=A0A239JQB0_9BACT|nr:ribonuclease P protein component [Pontibacter ummariensis]PRY07890.1 ribonuclease P protein component [Pontibacter ummariensis]SNT06964.1 ribonuclease P protein component [Pontibacter ummariensis]